MDTQPASPLTEDGYIYMYHGYASDLSAFYRGNATPAKACPPPFFCRYPRAATKQKHRSFHVQGGTNHNLLCLAAAADK